MSRPRSARPTPRVVAVAAAWLVALLLVPVAPAQAATDPDVEVTIDTLTPAVLQPGEAVTLAGTVRNDGDVTWTSTQAYASIARQPDTTRADLVDTIAEGTGFSGSRIVELETIAELGELEPGESVPFTITVPWADLSVTSAPGVRTLGVQVLGTAPDGTRSTTPIGRAATVVPTAGPAGLASVPGGLALTLASPVGRDATGDITGLDDLVAQVGPSGSLRRVLDLARSMPAGTATLVLDPQLLEAVTRLTDDDTAPDPTALAALELEETDLERVATFAADLRAAIASMPTLVIGYGGPDEAALAAAAGGAELREVVTAATDRVVESLDLPPSRAAWVPTDGLGPEVVRRVGDTQPLIVDVSNLPDWAESNGSVVTFATGDVSATAFVRRDLSSALPGAATAVTIRQQLLAERDLALRDRDDGPGSRADAVVTTPPGWDPGPAWRSADLSGLWTTGLLSPQAPDPVTPFADLAELGVPAASAVDTSVVAAVREVQLASQRLASISTDAAVAQADQLLMADLLGTSWRADPAAAIAIATERRGTLESNLALPTVEGPPSFLLAGREGQVPVTIDNPTDHPIRVGIRVSSTNPQLQVDDVAPVDVPAASRTTVTIPLDVGQQNTTSLTAQLVTPDGAPIGTVARFNVRSSNTSTIIWIAMGVASTLLVVAVARRLWRRSRGGASPSESDPAGPVPDDPPVDPPPVDEPPVDEPPVIPPPVEPTVAPSQQERSRVEDTSSTDVTRASAWMALGTLVSRVTGFLRALLLIWAIGTGLNGDIFNSANTVPNALYILVAGGVFNVVLVPQLVRTMRTDADGGDAYANRVITLGLLVLGVATAVLMLAAPLLVRLVFDSLLLTERFDDQRASALWLMYLCVPQVFFYGAFVLVGQVLNARGRFGPMMWAPIVNNLVACVALVGYMVMFGREGGSGGFSVGESLVLGVGSTLGIMAQAAVLIPYLRAAGFHYRPRFDFRGVGLGHTLRLGAWTLASIVVNQVAFIVVNRLGTEGNLLGASNDESSSGSAVYNLGYIVSQVPHGVITVSLATAVMPTLASLALARDYPRFLTTMSETARTALFLLVPVAVAIACLGHDLARSISLGAASSGSEAIGDTIVALAPAVVVYSLMFLLVRAFYADEDTRVPFVVQSIVAVTNVALAVTLTRAVSPQHVAPALGVALSSAYLVGALVALVWVRQRFGPVIDATMVGFLVRLTLACVGSAAAMLLTRESLLAIGLDSSRPSDAVVRLVVAGVIGAGIFLAASRLARMDELRSLATVIGSRR